jgi:hypothetical protein
VVSFLDPGRSYPCTGVAHSFFRDPDRLSSRFTEVCADDELLAAELNLLFWMVAVALFWGGLALHFTLSWSRRLQHGG